MGNNLKQAEKIRRKSTFCRNCGESLREQDNFCPHCGQENTDLNVSFWQLLRDFIFNQISLDTKLIRSIKPFFLSPGSLTTAFESGQRVNYVNPLRFYLMLSIAFFFIFSLTVMPKVEKEMAAIQSGLLTASDTLATNDILSEEDKLSFSVKGKEESPDRMLTFYQMINRGELTTEQLMDSLSLDKSSVLDRKLTEQIIKFQRNDFVVFISEVLDNTPLFLVLMLPLMGGVLKLFFRSRLYVTHMIHCLHLQSFAYVLLILFLLAFVIGLQWYWASLLFSIFFIPYSVVSMRRIYKNRLLLLIPKVFFVFVFYLSFLVILLHVNLVISFFLF